MCRQLTANGINAVLILDSAVGYVMERVDIVLVGAEGVVENGGIINKVCSVLCDLHLIVTCTNLVLQLRYNIK
jgi:translation initiation factor 2B subunit (eIF-2B alpha/beta/delta family)